MLLQARQTVEELIVKLLAHTPDLSAAQIFTKINRNRSRPYSLKAVYKELKKLIAQTVVLKTGRNYRLHLRWISELMSFTEKAERVYLAPPELVPQQKIKWKFRTLAKLEDFWADLAFKITIQQKPRIGLVWCPHAWWHLLPSGTAKLVESSYNLLYPQVQHYIIVGGRYPLDEWILKHRMAPEDICSTSRSPYESKRELYFNVYGDIITTVRLDRITVDKIERFFRTIHSFDNIKLADFNATFGEKVNATLTIETNKRKAQAYMKAFARFFGVRL